MRDITVDPNFIVKLWEKGEAIDLRHHADWGNGAHHMGEIRPVEFHVKLDGAIAPDGSDAPSFYLVLKDAEGRTFTAQISERMFEPALKELGYVYEKTLAEMSADGDLKGTLDDRLEEPETEGGRTLEEWGEHFQKMDKKPFSPMYPEVEIQLTGEDGNVYVIIGRVAVVLRRAGYDRAADEFVEEAHASESYDAVLQLCMRTVTCH